MRSERLSSAACGSHMERLHASELLSTSQGAPSSPSTSQLNVIPLSFTRIGSSSLEHFPEKLASDAIRRRTPVFRRKCSNEDRSEEHTSELQSLRHLVCRLLLEKKK